MSNLRKRFVLFTGLLAAASASTAFVVACSSTEDPPKSDGGTDGASDTGTGDTGTTDGGSDAGPDTFVPVEAGTLADFIAQNADATCSRYRECCGATGFDIAKCRADFKESGWVQSLTDLSVNGVATGGNVTYDPAAGSACLTAVRNMTCKDTPATEYKSAIEKCFQAAVGKVAVNGACRSNVECVKTAYCDLTGDAGTCTALKAAGALCTPLTGDCAYRNATGTSHCLGTAGAEVCGPSIPNGGECGFTDFDCTSGACNVVETDGGAVATCESTVDFLSGICRLYKDGG
ncbi:MAG: hypothetical protein JST00_27630 [Deltaproteobacteria bacterium]|nr:hypothetical protein [Deltaproteobacteria bacterium]